MTRGPRAVRSRVGLPVLAGAGEPPSTRPPAGAPASYYDIPFLKEPTWDWRVASYFFFESVSSGAFLMASLAELAGGDEHPNIRRAGYYTSFAAFLPCAPLLIWDLGRPARFHHMLRMFKHTSPMSHGSWSLAAYGLPMTALTAEQAWSDATFIPKFMRDASRIVPVRALGLLGIPCALMLATYPGVLLATTANPLWSRTPWLGALFACSSVHAGASAVALALRDSHMDERARIERIAAVAAAAEAAALGFVLLGTGGQARPLISGGIRRVFLVGAVGAGIVLPLLLRMLAPKTGKSGRIARFAVSALSLAGSFALKLAMVYGGHEAARDARASHRAAQ